MLDRTGQQALTRAVNGFTHTLNGLYDVAHAAVNP